MALHSTARERGDLSKRVKRYPEVSYPERIALPSSEYRNTNRLSQPENCLLLASYGYGFPSLSAYLALST